MDNNKSCLITQNLIGAINWFLTAPDSIIKEEKGGDGELTWSKKAKQDLWNILCRTPGDFPEAARQGVQFEKEVYKYANKKDIPGSNQFQSVCREVQGYKFYQKQGKKVTIGGEVCYLYCKYDAILPPSIKDIKTTAKYSNGKYLKGIQHELYCYVSGCKYFEYIIAEWDMFPRIKNIHKESYSVRDFNQLEEIIFGKVIEAFSVIKDTFSEDTGESFWDIYREKYCLY